MKTHPELVLDTHIWIWLATGEGNLTSSAVEALQTAANRSRILIPAIAIWELAMLEKRGKISLDKHIRHWIEDALAAPGLTLAPLTPEIAVDSCALPGEFHRDPADQLIVATARVERAILVTRDSRILDYARRGYVTAMSA